jgi:DNA-binding NtrC family response regulator
MKNVQSISERIEKEIKNLSLIKEDILLMEQAIGSFTVIQAKEFPTMEVAKQRNFLDAMRITKGHREEAAKLLGIPIRTFERYIVKYGFKHQVNKYDKRIKGDEKA